jgi:hypothetical protein
VAITGIVATMPCIALQLVGIQVVLGALGISGTGVVADLPLIIAFVIMAAFTYSSGLRAPASIAIVFRRAFDFRPLQQYRAKGDLAAPKCDFYSTSKSGRSGSPTK